MDRLRDCQPSGLVAIAVNAAVITITTIALKHFPVWGATDCDAKHALRVHAHAYRREDCTVPGMRHYPLLRKVLYWVNFCCLLRQLAQTECNLSFPD